jgi:hypothetical protein
MFPYSAFERASANAVNNAQLVSALCSCKVEGGIQPIERFFDPHAAKITFDEAADPRWGEQVGRRCAGR